MVAPKRQNRRRHQARPSEDAVRFADVSRVILRGSLRAMNIWSKRSRIQPADSEIECRRLGTTYRGSRHTYAGVSMA